MSVIKNRSLWALTLGHFSIDLYAGMLPMILLILIREPAGCGGQRHLDCWFHGQHGVRRQV